MVPDKAAAAAAIDAFLRALGRDATRELDLVGTGARVADAFADDLCQGYGVDVDALLREGVLEGSTTELVVARDVAVTTTCPHHLMLATGTATIAFAPSERLVGVGALARVVDAYARRLALQERIGEDVVLALGRALAPRWAGCRIVLTHGCMTARGERKHGARVETLALSRGLSDADRALAYVALGVGQSLSSRGTP